ncbi:hypothetical protein QF031_001242 [Pseudarthrobacter defluvii]|nr:hypothetical protein [Pseudarthrobacter defluvii]
MRRNTSTAAAPTPTKPAPSHTKAWDIPGNGRVEETARPALAGAAAACGMRVGWECRALMDSAVGRAGAGLAPGLAEPAWPAQATADSKPPAVAASDVPAVPAPVDWPAAAFVPVTDPPNGRAAAEAGGPDVVEEPAAADVPDAGAAPGVEAAVGTAAVGDPGWAGTWRDGACEVGICEVGACEVGACEVGAWEVGASGDGVREVGAWEDALAVGVVGAVVCPPVTRGVPETIGSGRPGRGSFAEAPPVARAAAVGAAAGDAVTAGRKAPGTAGRAGAGERTPLVGALSPFCETCWTLAPSPRSAAPAPAVAAGEACTVEAPAAEDCATGSCNGGGASSAKDACTPVERTSTAPTAAAAAPRWSPPGYRSGTWKARTCCKA